MIYTREDILEELYRYGREDKIINGILKDYLILIKDHLKIKWQHLDTFEDFHNLRNEIELVASIKILDYIAFTICPESEISKEDLSEHKIHLPPYIQNILNDNCRKIEMRPDGFKTDLYPNQRAILFQMLHLEENNFFSISKWAIRTNTGIISERKGFGKTFMIPALIAKQKIPKFFRPVENNRLIKIGTEHRFSDDPLLIPTQLVLCTTKNMKQWISNIQNFTNLSLHKIENERDLEQLKTKMKEFIPDVIIIKSGKIRRREALFHIHDAFRGFTFSRIFIDDFDKCDINGHILLPNSLFNWFITSDRNLYRYKLNEINNHKNSLYSLLNTQFNFFTILSNIKCCIDYANLDYKVTNIDYWYSPNESIIQNCILFSKNDFSKFISLNSPSIPKDKINIPFDPNKQNIKVLIFSNDIEKRIRIFEWLIAAEQKVIMLKKNNLDIFRISKITFGIISLIRGINLDFITHLIVVDNDDTFVHVIETTQRVSRISNLQVLFCTDQSNN